MIKTYTFHLYNPKLSAQIQVMINHANPIIIAKLMYKYEIEYFNDRKTIAEYRDMKTEWRLSENENNKLMIEYRGGELTMPTVRSSLVHVKVYYISKYPD